MKRELSIGMAHLYLSENSDQEFKYKKDGIMFDWNEFEKKLDMDFVDECIRNGLKAL